MVPLPLLVFQVKVCEKILVWSCPASVYDVLFKKYFWKNKKNKTECTSLGLILRGGTYESWKFVSFIVKSQNLFNKLKVLL